MQIRINFPPKTFVVRSFGFRSIRRSTKADTVRSLTKGYSLSISENYTAYLSFDRSTVRVFSLEKRRKKVENVTSKSLLKKGITRQVITPNHWVATYYDIPVAVLKAAKLKVVQGDRTWHLHTLH